MFGAELVTFSVSFLLGGSSFRRLISFAGNFSLNLVKVPGETALVPPFSFAFLPLPRETLPLTVTLAGVVPVRVTVTNFLAALAEALSFTTGQATWVVALCGQASWVSSPKPSLSASGSITALTDSWISGACLGKV